MSKAASTKAIGSIPREFALGKNDFVRDLALPDRLANTLWRGDELGGGTTPTVSSGFPSLDAELPVNGWPCGNITEILVPQYSICEWRLLLPSIAPLATPVKPLMVIASPHPPYFGGLRHHGLPERHVVIVRAELPAQRLWATEQACKARGLAGVMAWLPQVRADQVRRLQACALHFDGPVFLLRPDTARCEPSPAPLRVQVKPAGTGHLALHILKRRGVSHDGWLEIPALPPAFDRVIPSTRTQRHFQQLQSSQENGRAVLDSAPMRSACSVHALHP